ncbi:MAG: hypothetical protein M1830_007913 [Pleopsidium flavum]|nr:MAG: hypothetical protein M1830_007913 [Pleopsidium flavum]
MQAFFKLDEGYSEETRSQSGSDSAMDPDSIAGATPLQGPAPFLDLPNWILTLGEHQRSELAYTILRSLQTSSIAVIVERLNPLLHIDPVAILPPEVTSEIFSYLDPLTLLKAGLASHSWRERALDSQVWKRMYGFEGWGKEMDSIRSFEKSYTYLNKSVERKSRSRQAETDVEQHKHKRRARATGLSGGRSGCQQGTSCAHAPVQTPHQRIEQPRFAEAGFLSHQKLAEDEVNVAHDGQMQGLDFPMSAALSDLGDPSTLLKENSHGSSQMDEDDELDFAPSHTSAMAFGSRRDSAVSVTLSPCLMLPPSSGAARINWRFLYKQRKRLEDNWTSGRFKNFQFPHPDFPYESHTECVYTIQYSRKHLVSGSRDRTLRIWDLDTKRLVRKPLFGHTGSVLCLQFDDSPVEDIIVSGSSDTDVIIWRFSTGEIIKKLDHAHRESVLNLKFDDRFLITCSKDKTIRIWNRNPLLPTDKDYPLITQESGARYPTYIINKADYTFEELTEAIAKQRVKVLPPYSLLMTLDGHNAAVNAIQIHHDQIASASGDRTVKIWDVHSGKCVQTLQGHTKGIACVQFDGRRVVSGSSDNTVRIYDQATGAEVACLEGHTNLVRTVQAGFADLPGSEDALRAEARIVDREFFEARRMGVISDHPMPSTRRDRTRNPGSRDPKHVMAYGAELPPGGGGSRWGRIVSGSYDETVIIWKKDSEGRWVVCQKLRQEEAVRAAGGPIAALPPAIGWNYSPHTAQNMPTYQPLGTGSNGPSAQPFQPASQQNSYTYNQHGPMSANHIVQQAMDAGVAALNAGIQNIAHINNHLSNTQASSAQSVAQHQPPSNPNTHAGTNHVASAMAQAQLTATHLQGQNNAQAALQAAAGAGQPNSRVFKLQFDSRRIICCSQDPKIVGWDFANGDSEIIAASKFFAGP